MLYAGIVALVILAALIPAGFMLHRMSRDAWYAWNSLPTLPPAARGWTFAGFTPLGLFWLAHRSISGFILGLIPWVLLALCLWPLALLGYAIYGAVSGLVGRRIIWEKNRYSSEDEYASEMRKWSRRGVASLLFVYLGILWIVIYVEGL